MAFFHKKRNPNRLHSICQTAKSGICPMAGTEGFEPSRTVLETVILPLYYVPNFSFALPL